MNAQRTGQRAHGRGHGHGHGHRHGRGPLSGSRPLTIVRPRSTYISYFRASASPCACMYVCVCRRRTLGPYPASRHIESVRLSSTSLRRHGLCTCVCAARPQTAAQETEPLSASRTPEHRARLRIHHCRQSSNQRRGRRARSRERYLHGARLGVVRNCIRTLARGAMHNTISIQYPVFTGHSAPGIPNPNCSEV